MNSVEHTVWSFFRDNFISVDESRVPIVEEGAVQPRIHDYDSYAPLLRQKREFPGDSKGSLCWVVSTAVCIVGAGIGAAMFCWMCTDWTQNNSWANATLCVLIGFLFITTAILFCVCLRCLCNSECKGRSLKDRDIYASI